MKKKVNYTKKRFKQYEWIYLQWNTPFQFNKSRTSAMSKIDSDVYKIFKINENCKTKFLVVTDTETKKFTSINKVIAKFNDDANYNKIKTSFYYY